MASGIIFEFLLNSCVILFLGKTSDSDDVIDKDATIRCSDMHPYGSDDMPASSGHVRSTFKCLLP